MNYGTSCMHKFKKRETAQDGSLNSFVRYEDTLMVLFKTEGAFINQMYNIITIS